MSNERFRAEIEAYRLLTEVLEQADKARRQFAAANLPVPEVLRRLISTSEAEVSPQMDTDDAPEVWPPSRPAAASEDWIPVPARELYTQNLVLAILRRMGRAANMREILSAIIEYDPNVNPGTIYNVGPRLEGQLLEKHEDGSWTLLDPEIAPMLEGAYAWGAPHIFQNQERAAHRRLVIVGLLQSHPAGLIAADIRRRLQANDEYRLDVDKDMIKSDLKWLKEHNRVTVRPGSRRWITPENQHRDEQQSLVTSG
ncbi:MAG: hypothetical protein AAF750_13715 [Planctomycetota bacterium]